METNRRPLRAEPDPDEEDLDASLARALRLRLDEAVERRAGFRAKRLDLLPLEDLADPGAAGPDGRKSERKRPPGERDRAGVVGEGDAGRLGRRVGKKNIERGSDREKLLGPEGEDVRAEDAHVIGERDPHLVPIDADDEPPRADPLRRVLKPGSRRASKIDDAEARTDQTVLPVDLLELIEGTGGVTFPLRATKKKSFGSKRFTP